MTNLFELFDISTTHPPIEHTGLALAIKAAAISAARAGGPQSTASDDEVWETLRTKPISFDIMTLYLGALGGIMNDHQERIAALETHRAPWPPPTRTARGRERQEIWNDARRLNPIIR
jgi:hypothetical protein